MVRAPETLYDPRGGDSSVKVTELAIETDSDSGLFARSNYFTVCWIQEGQGQFWADSACHPLAAPSLLFFVPYQYVRFVAERPIRGIIVQFHANFLCIETYHEEVGCNGVLFNDLYGVPTVELEERHDREVAELIFQIRGELAEGGLAHSEILLSYLKVLLIRATRLKREQQGTLTGSTYDRFPPVLESLRELIEANYRRMHAPADYARLLDTDPKGLGKVVKAHLHKTLTDLIRDRILKHAKWDLLHTLKPVKQIAHELGYTDELYFSRLFKRATGHSPVFFREFETAIRGGRNLSMSLPLPSIPADPVDRKNGSSSASES
ncbi:AraC-type DNA-binding protein [Singulisphaera sp. GP187]|uniref:helix-turn-helix domain-containing protein n=1 Tax=Singulisphaera sp. GP187 TaxID=1882752 RepID=UPI00092784A9|nr:AraC family transcriptional regulator [Singulisphaera sp. GP187]SIO64802.1 AraC-type DNA-binding protein [Singulisphaera sp. GP187]